MEVCAAAPLIVSEGGERLHVTGSTANTGVTEQLRLIVPVNPFAGVTVMVAVFPVVAPRAIVIAEPLNENVGAAATVREMVVVAVSVPEVPLMVTVTGPPIAAVLLAVSVSTLEPAPGLGANAAVTPLGRPVAENVTLLANPPTPITETVLAPLLPWATDRADGEEESAKLGGGITVRAMVVDVFRLPEVPVMLTVTGPARAAVLLAVSVSTLELVAGLGVKDAVTPLGRPEIASVTTPTNWFAPVTEMMLVALLPWMTDSAAGEGEIVKLGGALMVRAIVVDAFWAP